jgi:hypothetical protein
MLKHWMLRGSFLKIRKSRQVRDPKRCYHVVDLYTDHVLVNDLSLSEAQEALASWRAAPEFRMPITVYPMKGQKR